MANKELTAKVRLDVKDAESKLKRLNKLINGLNKASNGKTVTALEKSIQREAITAEKVKQETLKTQLAEQKLAQQVAKTRVAEEKVNQTLAKTKKLKDEVEADTETITRTTKDWARALSGVNMKLNRGSGVLGAMCGKLRMLASTYLGVMGTKAMINTSDTITGAENKLNNVNAKALGAAGTNADGTYSDATFSATQEAMDKMYASAQKVRMGYGDMMSNVSKSMILAGDAFKGNIDNAIRFQEVMAEAYAVGGASAEEMSTSMYQMIQALGAGVLAGDELRSVREGAPLAYQAIEKFAQGIYNTEESLKDLASQGKITSDMVVAAIMHSSDEIDASFAQTYQTFAQTWTQIKNAAMRSFKPVSDMMREALNKAIDNGMIQKIESIFETVSKALMKVYQLTSDVVNWIVDNWSWLKNVIVGVFIAMISYSIASNLVSIACAVMTKIAWVESLTTIQLQALLTAATYIACFTLIIAAVMSVIYVFYLWKTGAIDTCNAITMALAIVGLAIMLIGVITYNTVAVVIGLILVLLGAIFHFFEQICGGISGVVSVIGAACETIFVFFDNLWKGAASEFWYFIGEILSGLKDLEPAFNAIAKLFGLEGVTLSGLVQSAYGKSEAFRGSMSSYPDFGDAWSTGYQRGANWASGVKGKINDWGSNLLGQSTSPSLGELNRGQGVGWDFPSAYDPANALNTTPIEDLLGDMNDKLGGVKGDTGSIKDSMELTEEDLKEFRKLANMEWRKEYTTAHIAVHMNNKNTINNKGDLDNWVISLRDMLTEEIDAVANGVYA